MSSDQALGVAASPSDHIAGSAFHVWGRRGRMPPWLLTMIVALVFSTAFGVILGVAELIHGGGLPGLLAKLIGTWVWGLLLPVILEIDRRLPFSEDQFYPRAISHLFLSVPFAIVRAAIDIPLEWVITRNGWNPVRIHENVYFYLLDSWTDYVVIACALLAFQYYRWFASSQLHAERLEKQLAQIRLHNLQMQLEPHFMSNALNSISSELARDPASARRIIADLGVLLRTSHEYKDRQLISLSEEMRLLEHYLAIQRIRFGGRLKIDKRIDPEALGAAVPCLLIQPIVENSVRHGLSGKRFSGTIEISAKRLGDRVVIRVADDGVGLPAEWRLETSKGQGLGVTRERLQILYPGVRCQFTVASRKDGFGTEVLISLPYQVAMIEA